MTKYANLPQVRTGYVELGEGDPLVLLHGGAVDGRFFAPNVEALAEFFTVYVLDLRGHGTTADVEGPYRYETLARDTMDFIEEVIGEPANVVGHSVGAGVGLVTALRHPGLVQDLVLISGAFHHSGMLGGTNEIDVDAVVEAFGPEYGEVSPDGEAHYPVVVRKVAEMDLVDPDLRAEDLAGVRAHTLVVTGDDDIITLEHTLALYRGLPNAELAIIPGTSHFLTQEKPDLVNAVIVDFLTLEPVATVAPIRRAPEGAYGGEFADTAGV